MFAKPRKMASRQAWRCGRQKGPVRTWYLFLPTMMTTFVFQGLQGISTVSTQTESSPTVLTRAGGAGLVYTCIVDGKEIHLYFEDAPGGAKWFLESKA